MSDRASIPDYVAEAEHYVRKGEEILEELQRINSSEARCLRASMYITAMKRLKRLIESHQELYNSEFYAESDATNPDNKQYRWWPSSKIALGAGLFRRRTG
ncbi:hypothetical protein [Methylobacterium sp. NEAU K]|uniref:hypothetical protein n=1 Tax=Methylobacterium sp. NEAU K TaxID=3064946 RepID=UPI002735290A|nr:hypothetical protein [Methylobacterium sp. NEAU K]MDP4005504.1 hypothetical protein [Methylobacterium sp. NEAU K]